MGDKYNKGSEWRKWDLHFHTPSSFDYGDDSVTNQEIIDILESNNISVVAITDHHLIDISRIKELQLLGKEKGITVLPGIEFRSELGGSEIIHFIGIFSENSNIEEIWTDIQAGCGLKPSQVTEVGDEKIYVGLKETTELIHKLKGITTVHAGRKSNTIENIRNNHDYKLQLKKDLLNEHIDILEIGKPDIDVEGYKDIVFPSIGFELPLIVCSDNHNIREYKLKENCWVKADPTFDGLKQVLIEPTERVFIGNEPEIISRVNNHKTKYFKNIRVNQVEGYRNQFGVWFDDVDIELNNELVAIIGNKGSGKSAIADITALCGNFKKHDSFSFLHKKKFRKGNLAKNFESSLTWYSGITDTRNLSDEPKDEQALNLKYLPQGDFENLTNEIGKAEEFQKEIENVVFSHLNDDEKLSFKDFDEMMESKKSLAEKEIKIIKENIDSINNEIIKLEVKLNPRYKAELEGKIKQKEEELNAVKTPIEVKNPNLDPEISKQNKEILDRIEEIKKSTAEINKKITENKEQKYSLLLQLQKLNTLQDEILLKIQEIKQFQEENREMLNNFNLKVEDVISLKADLAPITLIITKKKEELDKIHQLLGEKEGKQAENTLQQDLDNQETLLKLEQNKLDGPQKEYQKYLKEKSEWDEKKKQIEGDENKPNTLNQFKKELHYIQNKLTDDIEKNSIQRIEYVKSVFKVKEKIVEIYKKVKNKIDSKIEENASLLTDYKINIDASLIVRNGFTKKFIDLISSKRAGSFHSIEGGEIQLLKLMEGKNFNNIDDVILLLGTIIEYLKNDKRENQNNSNRYIDEQVNNLSEFYDYMFSLDYLDFNYKLKLGEKQIEQLSPGERGALLLVFYLLLDKNDIPLILDQPEDNLDNHSVANVLVPFIRKAKQKRQIILVTHNPNLAVVADAEQIIWVDIDKEDNKFKFISGSIEDREINKRIVNVLEGAMPAFNKRKQKYYDQ